MNETASRISNAARTWIAPTARLASTFRVEGLVAGLNAGNILAALSVQLVIFALIGASRATDAYFAAIAVPQMLISVLSPTFSGAVLPILSGRERRFQSELTLTVMGLTVLVLSVPTLLLFALAPVGVAVLFPGFKAADAALCVQLVRVLMLSLPLVAASAILSSLMQARERFARLESINLALALGFLVAIVVLLPRFGLVAAAWATLARYVVQVAVLSLDLRDAQLSWHRDDLRSMWRKARGLLAGNLYFKSDVLVDRHLLSMSAVGSLSTYAFALTIFSAIAGVLGQALASTALPALSRCWSSHNIGEFRRIFIRNQRLILIVSISCVVVVLATVPIALQLAGVSIAADGPPLALLMLLLVGVPVFGSAGALVTSAFYASRDTATPTRISVYSFTLFLLCKFTVFYLFGIAWFCVATTIYYVINYFVLRHLLHERIASA